MISKEELFSLKQEKKVLAASKDEARQEWIEAKIALNRSKDKQEYYEALHQVRLKSEILWWYEYQIDEISKQISDNYKKVWAHPKPRPEIGKQGKKKPRRGRRKK